MVKFLLIVFSILMTVSLPASVYENNCVGCHEELPVSIDKYFYRYLLKYSSKTGVKKAMKNYLLNPSEKDSVMGDAFINRFGIKNKTDLSTKQLEKALEDYWETYKVFGKLK